MTSFTHYIPCAHQRVAVEPNDGMTVGWLIAKGNAAGGGTTG